MTPDERDDDLEWFRDRALDLFGRQVKRAQDTRDEECLKMLALFMGPSRYGDMTYPERRVEPFESAITACIDAMELEMMGIRP